MMMNSIMYSNIVVNQLQQNVSSVSTEQYQEENSVVDPITGAVYEYRHLTRSPNAHI